MSRASPLLLCALLVLSGCLGGAPADAPYGRGGLVEGEVVPNDRAPDPAEFDSAAVQSDEHVREAVVEAVESPDGTSSVSFDAGEGASVYESSQRLGEADVTFVDAGYAVAYQNHTVVVRILYYS